MSSIVMFTGGAASGKSSKALELAMTYPPRRTFIATAQGLDEEMRLKIKRHQEERGDNFYTIEEPLDLGKALQKAASDSTIILVDCLTLWASNLLLAGSKSVKEETDKMFQVLKEIDCPLILVTNEVGMGMVPESALGREYRYLLGRINRYCAEEAEQLVLMVAGQALNIKN